MEQPSMLVVELHTLLIMPGHTIGLSPLAVVQLHLESVAPWENEGMSSARTSFLSPRIKAATIAVLVVALAVFTWVTPPRAVVLQNVLHHLNFLPFMLAGMLFGWRGALKTLLLAMVLQAPSINRHWDSAPLDAQDQITELSVFAAAGVI